MTINIKDSMSNWFPVLSRYLGAAGVFYELVLLRTMFHLPPDPTALIICAGMMGSSEAINALRGTKPELALSNSEKKENNEKKESNE